MRTAAQIGILVCLLAGPAWSQTAGGVPATSSATAPSAATSAPTTSTAPVTAIKPLSTASAPTTATAPSAEDVAAAESLRNSALALMYSPSPELGKMQRIEVLGNYAEKLQPGDPRTGVVLSYVYENQGNLEAAAGVAWRRLSVEPMDYALGVRYLQLASAVPKRPNEKRAFLESVLNKEQVPASLRSQAASFLADLQLRAGQKEQAAQLLLQAVQLDPYNAEAAQALNTATGQKPTAMDGAKTLVTLFRVNPGNGSIALNLAYALNYLGLHRQSLAFFDLVWELTGQTKGNPGAELAMQYLNVILDAGEYDKALRVAEGLPKDAAKDRQIRSLIVEAYRRLGQAEKADELAQRILSEYPSRDPNSLPPQVAAELAGFLIATETTQDQILPYARRAVGANPESPAGQRLLGLAEVKSGQTDLVSAGLGRLEKLKTSDPFAAVVLAETRLSAGQDDLGKETLLMAAGASQSGLTYRRMLALAKQKGIQLPPLPGVDTVGQAAEQAIHDSLPMGAKPEDYVSVSLKAGKASFAPGEPIEIEATLTNKSNVEIPLGAWGLFRPTMTLQVSVASATKERFAGIPPVEWPAPRCLAPGASVRRTIRLDIGSLAYFLAIHPFEEMKLTASGLVDPMQKRLLKEESSIPGICPEPLTIARANLVAVPREDVPEAWSQAYQHALRVIVTDLSRGDLQRRLRAARQVASLVLAVREIERGKVKLPDPLRGAINKPVLLAMLRKALEDRSPVVRAETLVGLGGTKLDEAVAALVLPMGDDTSPLVRFRLAELLGVSRAPGPKAVMDRLFQDDDPLVKAMAGIFQQSSPTR